MPGPRVAAIIPFFQRRPGLLARAVRSALDQQGAECRVVVVDDGSPVAAETELAALEAAERARVRVIRQANAGPGAARNRGLQSLPPDITFAAFLDSDDIWVADHLARALSALDAGADLYFTDYVPLHSDRSTFALCRFPDRPVEPGGDDLFVYPGALFDALLARSPVGTSTVVYRRAIATEGFPTRFSYAEDVYFWMHLARHARKIVFSTRCEAIYGAGVNIAAAATWGSPGALRRLHSEYRFHHAVAEGYALTGEQLGWSRRYRGQVFKSYWATLLHLAVRRSPFGWRQALELVALEARRRIGR